VIDYSDGFATGQQGGATEGEREQKEFHAIGSTWPESPKTSAMVL
jgi:hypothetical protein